MTNHAVPNREDCVLRYLLDRHAEAAGERPFIVLRDGREISYASLQADVRAIARALQDLGVKQDAPVRVWMPSGLEAVKLWFAINYVGAIYVPINTGYRGGILEHVVRNSGATLMLAHAELAGRLADIDKAKLKTVVA